MPYKVLRTGGSKIFVPSWFNSNNELITLPEGTSFSANTSDFNIGTASINNDGNIVFTPQGSVTGNVYVNCVATLPAGQFVYASMLVHVTDNVDETTNYGTFTIG